MARAAFQVKQSVRINLDQAKNSLMKNFPFAKCMWNILKDIQDGKLDANVFSDGSDFTTLITQEFTPRVSEVACLRIYSEDKEKVMQVINDANLLKDTGRWQAIHYYTKPEDSKEMTKYLMESLQQHQCATGKTVSLVFNYPIHHLPGDYIKYPTPPGYTLKVLQPECAELMAKYWKPEYPLEHRTRFLRDTLKKFDIIGAYAADNLSVPLSWIGQRPGGVQALAYTMKEYRSKHLFAAVWSELTRRMKEKGENILVETDQVDPIRVGFETIGHSHIITIQ